MFQVTTVDMQKPPPDFRTNFEATHPPILIDNGLSVLENEKIERHIMKNVPGGHNLFIQVCIKVSFYITKINEYLLNIISSISGQRSRHADRKPLFQTEVSISQKGWAKICEPPLTSDTDRQSVGQEEHSILDGWYHVLFRLRVDAQTSTHSCGCKIFRRFRNTRKASSDFCLFCTFFDYNIRFFAAHTTSTLALYASHVPAGCIHTILSSRSRYYQSL